jgi:hypothetical protein
MHCSCPALAHADFASHVALIFALLLPWFSLGVMRLSLGMVEPLCVHAAMGCLVPCRPWLKVSWLLAST